jgi:mycothiol synthase
MGHNPEQVQMIWPDGQQITPSAMPEGYLMRTYQPGDEAGFYNLMDSVGWAGWDADRLQPWLYRILPSGWFFAVHEQSRKIVGTCMATHDPTWEVPFCGEVAWTAVHPNHQGAWIGRTLVSAVLVRFLEASYSCIHLYTEIWRLAALKVYLCLGLVPYLVPPGTVEQWGRICSQLEWPFTPENWPASLEL